MPTPTPALWDDTCQALLRAERLLSHSLEGLERGQQQRRHDRHSLALELEQALLPLRELNSGLGGVIEEMAADRQDNRLQRWQGRLQQLLQPMDEGTQRLQELLVLLDQPLPPATAAEPAAPRALQERVQQLEQLLQRRQKQVLGLQAELQTLQQQLFAASVSATPSADALPPEPGEDQSSTPSIFS
jgi:chromosome segregation ATPase